MKLCSLLTSKTEFYCAVSQFLHSYICERFIYFQDRSVHFAAAKYVDRSWEYINRSQTHECGNWDGTEAAIPRKGTHKWDFRCSVESTLSCLAWTNKVEGRELDPFLCQKIIYIVNLNIDDAY